MKGKDIKEIIKTAITLFVICAVAAGLLAAINGLTAPAIAENDLKKANESRKTVFPEATSFEETTAADGNVFYIAFTDGEKSGYVFTTSANGYGGKIKLMTGIDVDGNITKVSVLEINETPGLGMKAKNESFLEQFSGKSQKLTVTKNGKAAENEIDAITSATISSDAVTNAVNCALEMYNTIMSGEEE